LSRIALFAYASLVNPASAAETLERPVEIAALARLRGWSRGWTVARDNRTTEKTLARPDGTIPRYCLGLDVSPDAASPGPNGALIELTETELDRLDLRELRYRRADVTRAIEPRAAGFEAVYTFRARPEHYHPEAPGDAIVVATYPAAVEVAFAALGDDQLELYRATTPPPPVEVTPAKLVTDRIPAGNPRTW
jgi:hypothetical protein